MSFNEIMFWALGIEAFIWALFAGLSGGRTETSPIFELIRVLTGLAFYLTLLVAGIGWIARAAVSSP